MYCFPCLFFDFEITKTFFLFLMSLHANVVEALTIFCFRVIAYRYLVRLWAGNRPVCGPLAIQGKTKIKRRRSSVSRVGFELIIPGSELPRSFQEALLSICMLMKDVRRIMKYLSFQGCRK
jgi:hypothetical protein